MLTASIILYLSGMEPQGSNTSPIMPSYRPPNDSEQTGEESQPAVELIRQKLDKLYKSEPNVQQESEETEKVRPKSKHQLFIHKLTESGMSLAEIQTAWHNYYIDLSDDEKHEVWQEFYHEHTKQSHYLKATQPRGEAEHHKPEHHEQPEPKRKSSPRSVADIKKQIASKVNARGQLKPKQHLQSLMFGLGLGSIVVLLLLFSFFNERIIAPFMTPSKHISATSIIIDPGTTAVSPDPKIIIPKINVEIPVDYTQTSIDENAVQKTLENGILHYPTTSLPGQNGNAAFFGHSSNNIFNSGKYKFAFVLLKRLEPGDVFYLDKDGTRYAYRVYEKKIVKPEEVGVLGPASKPATATLITCDPPGTSINRLVVVGEQISPDPAANKASTAPTSPTQPQILPSNAPSLWERLVNWLGH